MYVCICKQIHIYIYIIIYTYTYMNELFPTHVSQWVMAHMACVCALARASVCVRLCVCCWCTWKYTRS